MPMDTAAVMTKATVQKIDLENRRDGFMTPPSTATATTTTTADDDERVLSVAPVSGGMRQQLDELPVNRKGGSVNATNFR
jgi:hypothetical protein